MARFYGIGVGPGDPELITLKAVKILSDIDVVVAPSGTGQESIALEIVKPYLKTAEVVLIDFPMTKDHSLLQRKWKENVEIIKGFLDSGKNTAFITIGDPMIYSTYIYILKHLNGYKVETIPGITSFTAAAARLNIPIAEGSQPFVVIPSNDIDVIEEVLSTYHNVILMKVARNYDEIIRLLSEKGFEAGLAIRCGHPDEVVTRDLGQFSGRKIDYLSLIIAKKR
ncbi:precorrin-2/cobalt-factor-2 C20-methyltransferase [Caldanaerobius fijiensis DSM 17918]|uniref:Precorrin-2/cobalt-factor-2 C20-methyltransferase n=1 Tax=Caldanaerobius fijiensis DSM 17918 TaxID=1121256 RepID=A0A1M4YMS3_9THEO|nr:precorrin-2 C(20)-methyltransferase [Caldanaerobius fijiensis]SHF07109.1 precorrin-2/cobalt-factor-2 C20-methyltransferase [Caldanaerobius fijiensis DSM 17918]